MNIKNKKAFTLLEVIITMAILGIVMVATLSIFVDSLGIYTQYNNLSKVQNNANFMLNVLRRDIENGKKIIKPTADLPFTIKIEDPNSPLNEPLFDTWTFDNPNGKLIYTSKIGTSQELDGLEKGGASHFSFSIDNKILTIFLSMEKINNLTIEKTVSEKKSGANMYDDIITQIDISDKVVE